MSRHKGVWWKILTIQVSPSFAHVEGTEMSKRTTSFDHSLSTANIWQEFIILTALFSPSQKYVAPVMQTAIVLVPVIHGQPERVFLN